VRRDPGKLKQLERNLGVDDRRFDLDTASLRRGNQAAAQFVKKWVHGHASLQLDTGQTHRLALIPSLFEPSGEARDQTKSARLPQSQRSVGRRLAGTAAKLFAPVGIVLWLVVLAGLAAPFLVHERPAAGVRLSPVAAPIVVLAGVLALRAAIIFGAQS
jgi:hypothetical protein